MEDKIILNFKTKNILNFYEIEPWSIIWMHTAPGAYLLHTPGAVCISNMFLEYILFRIFFQIINGPGTYDPGASGPGP